MVKLDLVRSYNAALVQTQSLVAVFVGATSGIGRATLYALAKVHGEHTKNNGQGNGQGNGQSNAQSLRAYVVGRKRAAVEAIISECERLCPAGRFVFVQAHDLSLLEEVDRVCADITRMEHDEAAAEAEAETAGGGAPARVDLLCMSQGDFTFEPRKDTTEGLEFRISLLYYSRMKFAVNLLPLLRASSLPAHIISVFGAGKEGQLDVDDLLLRSGGHFSMASMRSHVVYMTTFFMEYLAAQNPGHLSLVHVFPGLIMTEAFQNLGVPAWARLLWSLLAPVTSWFTTPVAECGERMLFLASPQRFPARGSGQASGDMDPPRVSSASAGAGAKPGASNPIDIATGSDGILGSGAYAVGSDGETVRNEQAYEKHRAQGVGEKLVAHTLKAFEDIKASKVFTG